MPNPRESPYIWTTWLPKLLTGDNSCEWAVWLKAHYQDWDKVPSDFSQADWLVKHTALLNEQKAQWEEPGYDVHVEGQNAFRLRGKSATLAGRPDLIVDRFDDALIIDVKTGREQAWHAVQVMIYMYALPRALPQYRDIQLAGAVAYPTHTVEVPTIGRDGKFARNLASLIRRLASDTPPERIPSAHECRFCDISSAECPERVEDGDQPAEGTTDEF